MQNLLAMVVIVILVMVVMGFLWLFATGQSPRGAKRSGVFKFTSEGQEQVKWLASITGEMEEQKIIEHALNHYVWILRDQTNDRTILSVKNSDLESIASSVPDSQNITELVHQVKNSEAAREYFSKVNPPREQKAVNA